MIALNEAQKIRDAIAEKIGVKKAEGDFFTVDIPWTYPDGDQCRVYLTRGADGGWNATDGGSSVMRAAESANVDVLQKGYVERFRQIVTLYGLREDEGELLADESPDVGDAVFNIAQASIDVVHLSRLPKERPHSPKSKFVEKLSKLIESAVSVEHFKKNWTDATHDEKQRYPVTYRIDPSRGNPIFLWAVGSSESCLRATASCLFHQMHNSFCGSAVYAKKKAIPTKDAARLDDLLDRSFASLNDVASIRDFLRPHPDANHLS